MEEIKVGPEVELRLDEVKGLEDELKSLRESSESERKANYENVQKELDQKCKQLALDLLKDTNFSDEDKKSVFNALDSIKDNPSLDNINKNIKALEKKNGAWESLKRFARDSLEKVRSVFTEIDYQSMDDKYKDIGKVEVDETKLREYSKDVDQKMKEMSNSENVDNLKEKGLSDNTMKVLMFLAAAGSIVGGLFLFSAALTGCYQYKTGQLSTQLNCDYNKDNRDDCSCGTNVNNCDGSEAKHPYCKCNQVKGQYCGGTDNIYYNYEVYNPYTLIKALADFIANLGKKAGDFLGDFWIWFKKIGWIVFLVICVLIGIWATVKVYNTYESTVTHSHPDT